MQLGFTANLATEKNHKYSKAAGSEGAQPRPRMVRVGKEVAGLNMDLPLNPSSSVFVRIDEQNMTLWQALITGAPTLYRHWRPTQNLCTPPNLPHLQILSLARSGLQACNYPPALRLPIVHAASVRSILVVCCFMQCWRGGG